MGLVRSQCRWRLRAGHDCKLRLALGGHRYRWWMGCIRNAVLSLLVSDCLCMRRGGIFQNILSASGTPSLSRDIPCEICLETCKLNFVWRDYLYMRVKCEFPECICTSKSLALNCLQKVNKD